MLYWRCGDKSRMRPYEAEASREAGVMSFLLAVIGTVIAVLLWLVLAELRAIRQALIVANDQNVRGNDLILKGQRRLLAEMEFEHRRSPVDKIELNRSVD